MTQSTRWGIALVLALAGASSPHAGAASQDVVACRTLVDLRVLMQQAPGHEAALARLGDHPGCRRVSRDRIGSAEHRAMVGGAPFECLIVEGEPVCLWIMP